MSVDFTQPPSSASIPDASESVKGKIRIATSAEATAGTNDLTAMTPLKVQSVVNTALVGGVTYQGTFDASSPADLSNASKGDLYIISVAGTYQGQSWAVGDHLLINADMGGTLDPSKIDKVDNTDAVTSVAGRTGAITLSTADVSGLATVASTGAYSDLSGTPTLGTSAALDVGTSANNVVQLDGSGLLPAVDGSQLTNLPAPTLELNDLTDVTFTAGAGIDNYVLTYDNTSGLWGAEASAGAPLASETVAGILEIATNAEATAGTATDKALVPSNISSITTAQLDNSAGTMLEAANNLSDIANTATARTNLGLGTASVEDVGTSAGNVVQLDGSARLPAVDGSQLTNLPAPTIALNDLTDVTITSASTGEVLRYDGAEWVDAQLAYSDLSGTPTNVSTFSNDAGYLTDITAENIGDLADVDITGLADGEILIYNSTSGNWESNPPPAPLATTTSVGLIEIAENAEATAGTATDKALVPSNISSITTAQLDNIAGTMLESANNLSDLANAATARTNLGLAAVASTGAYSDLSGTPTNVSTFTNDAGYLTDITAENIGDLADVDLTGLADGEILIYNSTSGNWESNPPPAPLATTTSVGLIEIAENAEATAGTATDKALVPSNISSITTAQLDNSAGTMLEAANNLSDLANAATARTNLGLGSASVEDVGTSAGNVVQLNGSAQLPAVDGSLLTGVVADISGASVGDLSDVTITAAATGEVLRYNGAEWVDAQLAYSDISGLGTSAVLDAGTSANNVVQLNGSAQLPALDGSLLTGVTADLSGATLDDISDVSYPAAPTKNQLLQWNSTTSKWEPVDATTVTSDAPGSSYSVTTHKGLEEVYILSPSTTCNVSIPTATTAGEGFKYQFKLMTANAMTINETIDGVSGLTISNQYSSATIVSDGSAWYLI